MMSVHKEILPSGTVSWVVKYTDPTARLDDVADALRRAQLAEDDEVRHDHIFAAHKALVRAEATF